MKKSGQNKKKKAGASWQQILLAVIAITMVLAMIVSMISAY